MDFPILKQAHVYLERTSGDSLVISLAALNIPLQTEAAPVGIVSFEFAGDLDTANEILDSWGATGRVYARISMRLGYLYLLVYSIAVGLGCVLLSDRLSRRAASLGIWAAWGMVAAAVFNAVENYAMIRLLIDTGRPWWPGIVY